jgi:hypothetical protein
MSEKRAPIIQQKLSLKDAADIRRAALGGATTQELANRHGVGVYTVRAVLRYDRLPPQLEPRHGQRLAVLATARNCTIDDALEAVLIEARA